MASGGAEPFPQPLELCADRKSARLCSKFVEPLQASKVCGSAQPCQPNYCALRLLRPLRFLSRAWCWRDATVDAIKEEYKKLTLHYHPDKHAASECDIWNTQFQILNTTEPS